MKLAIMQPYFFPYIGYWQLLQAADEFVILDDVNYIQRGWINRNRIWCDGREYFLINPIDHSSQNKLICDMNFINESKYMRDMLRTIRYAYRKAPYVQCSMEILTRIVMNPQSNVVDYLEYEIREMCKWLGIQTNISRASMYRERVHKKGQEGILALSKFLGCDMYINPIGGLDLYDKSVFEKENIELAFLKTDFESISRISGSEQMNCSIIDIMTRYPVDKIQQMLGCYNLI